MTRTMTARDTFDALRTAVEARDADAAAAVYADDVTRTSYRKNLPASRPQRVHGKAELVKGLQDVFGRDLTHRLSNEVVAEDRIAFTEECRYAGGGLVMAASFCDLRDGKIARELTMEIWDD